MILLRIVGRDTHSSDTHSSDTHSCDALSARRRWSAIK
jgi:hypothetical protein